jgi:hypothetical protein
LVSAVAKPAWVAEKGLQATTTEEIAALEVAPCAFFRYLLTRVEVIAWSQYQPMLAGYVADRPGEPAIEALRHGIVNRLAAFYDHALEWLAAACRHGSAGQVRPPRRQGVGRLVGPEHRNLVQVDGDRLWPRRSRCWPGSGTYGLQAADPTARSGP